MGKYYWAGRSVFDPGCGHEHETAEDAKGCLCLGRNVYVSDDAGKRLACDPED